MSPSVNFLLVLVFIVGCFVISLLVLLLGLLLIAGGGLAQWDRIHRERWLQTEGVEAIARITDRRISSSDDSDTYLVRNPYLLGMGLQIVLCRLFTQFTRLHQVRIEGHGLGLSIVQRIVAKLGGAVGVESEVGRGSRFWFMLPGTGVM